MDLLFDDTIVKHLRFGARQVAIFFLDLFKQVIETLIRIDFTEYPSSNLHTVTTYKINNIHGLCFRSFSLSFQWKYRVKCRVITTSIYCTKNTDDLVNSPSVTGFIIFAGISIFFYC